MKKIAVLMTCYNRVATTLECLRRLFGQEIPTGYSFDVWLVDDASPDKTGERVKAAYPQVNVIQGTGKLFWCRGMRLAWDKAAEAYDYDFYLWLNDDTFMVQTGLGQILSMSEQQPGVIVSGKIQDPRNGHIIYGASTENLNGNVLLVPDSVYRRIGSLDLRFHQRYGDHDYGLRAKQANITITVSDEVIGLCRFNFGPIGRTKQWGFCRRWQSFFQPAEFHLGDAFLYSCKWHGFFYGVMSVVHIFFKVMTGKA